MLAHLKNNAISSELYVIRKYIAHFMLVGKIIMIVITSLGSHQLFYHEKGR